MKEGTRGETQRDAGNSNVKEKRIKEPPCSVLCLHNLVSVQCGCKSSCINAALYRVT